MADAQIADVGAATQRAHIGLLFGVVLFGEGRVMMWRGIGRVMKIGCGFYGWLMHLRLNVTI